jgi:hypothetical protein
LPAVRTMFWSHVAVIATGIAVYMIVGLGHY